MIFTEFSFFVFFALVFTTYWSLDSNKARKYLLLIASYVFYGWWDPRFCLLIFASTILDYFVARKMVLSEQPYRKRWLIVSLTVNLGTLGFFKYFNFFIDSASNVLSPFGFEPNVSTLEIILPVGISFFTFQTMSYTIDVYKKQCDLAKSLLDFSLFVAFFPQLVAGPIVRARDFLVQLDDLKVRSYIDFRPLVALFLIGYFKKACISDPLGLAIDPIFASPESFNSLSLWSAMFLYSVQIYCDFSGYTDMAIATAGFLGFGLLKNFDAPYLATDLQDFWRRWHISLSSWLRDYLYIPLGGNRGSKWFSARNLMLTMLLGGLWHGAAWNFVIWGFLHGLGLSVQRIWRAYIGPTAFRQKYHLFWTMPLTYLFVCICWVFFRSRDFNSAVLFLKGLLPLESVIMPTRYLTSMSLVLFLCLAILHAVSHFFGHKVAARASNVSVWTIWFGIGIASGVLLFFTPIGSRPFIYFQF